MTAERMLEAMTVAKLGQAELARRVGVTPGAINQIAMGTTRKSRLLPDIARELHVSLEWLMGNVDDPAAGSAEALTGQERRLLEIYRQLPNRDRAALKLLLERMASESPPSD